MPVYSVGYREAVLEYLDNGHTYREACKEFKINCATLCNWVKRKRELDSLEANYHGRKYIINLEELKKYVGTRMLINMKLQKSFTVHSLLFVTT